MGSNGCRAVTQVPGAGHPIVGHAVERGQRPGPCSQSRPIKPAIGTIIGADLGPLYPTGRKFLLHDRDALFAGSFDAVFRSEGLRVIRTPVRASRANPVCGRPIGSLRARALS